jgi:hypothetical protein
MSKENEVWVVFKGKLMTDPNVEAPPDFDIGNINEVVEVIKAERISKSYIKLKENPMFHPNVAYGDIMKVKACDTSLSNTVAIIEFNGVEHEEIEGVSETDVNDLGSDKIGLSPNIVNLMKSFDSKARPVIQDKFEQGLVFEPVAMISHGSYKINISYEADDDNFNKMKDHFKEWDVYFQKSSASQLGSVAFGLETKFKKAVECLESAPCVKGCYLAFTPEEFPQIDFDPEYIPKQ